MSAAEKFVVEPESTLVVPSDPAKRPESRDHLSLVVDNTRQQVKEVEKPGIIARIGNWVKDAVDFVMFKPDPRPLEPSFAGSPDFRPNRFHSEVNPAELKEMELVDKNGPLAALFGHLRSLPTKFFLGKLDASFRNVDGEAAKKYVDHFLGNTWHRELLVRTNHASIMDTFRMIDPRKVGWVQAMAMVPLFPFWAPFKVLGIISNSLERLDHYDWSTHTVYQYMAEGSDIDQSLGVPLLADLEAAGYELTPEQAEAVARLLARPVLMHEIGHARWGDQARIPFLLGLVHRIPFGDLLLEWFGSNIAMRSMGSPNDPVANARRAEMLKVLSPAYGSYCGATLAEFFLSMGIPLHAASIIAGHLYARKDNHLKGENIFYGDGFPGMFGSFMIKAKELIFGRKPKRRPGDKLVATT